MLTSDIRYLDMNQRTAIGQRIQDKRMEAGISGEELGSFLNISGNQVSRIETGKVKCSLEHIFVIAQILDCTTDYLLFGKKEQPSVTAEQKRLIESLYHSIER